MSIENFPGNSHRANRPLANNNQPSAQSEPKFEPVVTGKVTRRKKPLGRRVLDTIFRGEGGVFTYLIKEVLVPNIQYLIIETVTQGVERAVGNTVRIPRNGPPVIQRSGPPSRTVINYNNPSSITRSPISQSPVMRQPAMSPSSIEMEQIVLPTQFEAEVIGEKLYEAIRDYDYATVANVRELLGESPVPTDYKWGWEGDDNPEFVVKRVRLSNNEVGWLLQLPQPKVLPR